MQKFVILLICCMSLEPKTAAWSQRVHTNRPADLLHPEEVDVPKRVPIFAFLGLFW